MTIVDNKYSREKGDCKKMTGCRIKRVGFFLQVKEYVYLLRFNPTLKAVVRRCSVIKVVLKNFQNSQENICARASFWIKLQTWSPTTLLKYKLWSRCFPVNFAKFLRKPFFIEHLRWTLLQHTFLYFIRWW